MLYRLLLSNNYTEYVKQLLWVVTQAVMQLLHVPHFSGHLTV